MKPLDLMEPEKLPYPNLAEVVNWNMVGMPAIAEHANVDIDILKDALMGDDELAHNEMLGISSLTKVPVSVLELPKLCMMDCNKFQHIMKVLDLQDDMHLIKEFRKKAGKGNDPVLRSAERTVEAYVSRFKSGKGTYIGYLTARKDVDWNFWLYKNIDNGKPRATRIKKGGSK